ncbi:MAG: adenosine deaminase [Bryobacteraceae bacterium]
MGSPYQNWLKAELHIHLEGAIEPETLSELAPELSPEEIREHYEFHSFLGFLGCFERITRHLRRPEDYALALRRLLERLEREKVRYAEITHSAGIVFWRGQDPEAVFEALRDAARGSPVQVRWILDAVRQFGVDHAAQVAEFASAHLADGVVAFGVGGDEARGPARDFAEVYRMVRSRGLRLTAHAGETGGPDSVWAALEIGAERIGHGIRSIEDPVLVRHLADRQIPLEICLTSNLATGAVPSLEQHPVRQLFEAGVPVTLNTDDPALFRTTLSKEYELAATSFGFPEHQLREIAQNAFRFAFAAQVDRETTS